jgi:hypothetical protein
MYTKKKHPKIHKKRINKNTRKKGGKSVSFQNFQNVGRTIDKFLQNFNIDELSKKNASEYLGYKTYNRNNLFKFTLLPSTIKDNEYSGVKFTKHVKYDNGLSFFDKIGYDITGVNEGLGELILGYYNITNKNNRKGVYKKEVNIKETLRDNIPPVEEENLERFVNKRFDHV